ncbi:hypothetical protein [Streptomyces sp. NPDC093544]|uniref:hypothetical protein n=1 Tax=Streptomyces sp. NPDC093544 TaxID=3155200 RepID=UPI0034127DFF
MAQKQPAGTRVGWTLLVLVGAIGNLVALVSGSPVIIVVATTIGIIGVVGLMSARRKQQS